MRRFLPHYRHRAGIDTLCFTVRDTRGSTPPACLYRYARVYYKDKTQVVKGIRWRAHTTRGGYLYVRIDAEHPAVPMDKKSLSSRVATVLALLGVPWQTWGAARVKRVDVAYDTCVERVPNGLTPDQKRRKMKRWEYREKFALSPIFLFRSVEQQATHTQSKQTLGEKEPRFTSIPHGELRMVKGGT